MRKQGRLNAALLVHLHWYEDVSRYPLMSSYGRRGVQADAVCLAATVVELLRDVLHALWCVVGAPVQAPACEGLKWKRRLREEAK